MCTGVYTQILEVKRRIYTASHAEFGEELAADDRLSTRSSGQILPLEKTPESEPPKLLQIAVRHGNRRVARHAIDLSLPTSIPSSAICLGLYIETGNLCPKG